ncbi:hypothetical protein [Salmonella enterica]|uniref:hypothetical protein n=1 Tax=Salmonella enterica TaxID=28901 RepID=UPI001E4DDA84|nr:hypothetical protein [Salmonella enterica]
MLFSATEKTQKPFLTHLIKSKLKYDDDLGEYLKRTIKIMFGTNPHKETVNLLKSLIPYFEEGDQQKIIDELSLFTWHSGQDKYTHPDSWLDNTTEVMQHTQATYNSNFNVTSVFDEIAIRATLQLINSVSRNYVQYDHIYPLINKIIAMSSSLAKVIEINDVQQNNKPISIISLKECNQSIKKPFQ